MVRPPANRSQTWADIEVPFTINDRVMTTQEVTTDWTRDVKQTRRWGVTGTIIGTSQGHGLCYHVRHDQVSNSESLPISSWYDPKELVSAVGFWSINVKG